MKDKNKTCDVKSTDVSAPIIPNPQPKYVMDQIVCNSWCDQELTIIGMQLKPDWEDDVQGNNTIPVDAQWYYLLAIWESYPSGTHHWNDQGWDSEEEITRNMEKHNKT